MKTRVAKIWSVIQPLEVAALISVFGIAATRAESLDQFRGPRGNGVAAVANLPITWGEQENIAWQAALPGAGWSSPVVAGDSVFVTTAVSDDGRKPVGFTGGVASMRGRDRDAATAPASFEVHCLRVSDGSTRWSKSVAKQSPPYQVHASNTFATESPTTDGNYVYAYFAAIGLVVSLDLDGQEIWRLDVGAYPTSNDFGTGSSLTIFEERLFLQNDNLTNSFLMAIDAANGETLWRRDRDGKSGWSTPVIWNTTERTELVTCGSGNVTAHDPATGDVLWKLEDIDGSFSSSPATDAARIYFGNSGPGRRGPLVAVGAGAAGTLRMNSASPSAEAVSWSTSAAGPGMSSPVAVSGYVYVVSRNVLSCHDAASGERVYRERLPGGSAVTSSLWATDDAVYVLDEDGTTFVVQVGPDFELLAKNTIEGLYWATPAVSRDAILLRSAETLYCIRSN